MIVKMIIFDDMCAYGDHSSYTNVVTETINVDETDSTEMRYITYPIDDSNQDPNQDINQNTDQLVEKVENKEESPKHEVQECTKEETVMEKRKRLAVRGLCGLGNIGNTCYMNSILQCLNSLPWLSAYLRKKMFMDRLRNNKLMKASTTKDQNNKTGAIQVSMKEIEKQCEETLVFRLATLLEAMWDENTKIEPRTFKRTVGEMNPTFKGFDQNDSQELLNFILDKINEETKAKVDIEFSEVPEEVVALSKERNKCRAIFDNPNVSDEDKQLAIDHYKLYRKQNHSAGVYMKALTYWKSFIRKEHSIITDLFTGLFYSDITCDKCQNKSSSFDPFTILSIETKETGETTLENCLLQFSKEEVLTGDNKYYCETCKTHNDAKKKLYIWEPPEILIIQLKRFKNEKTVYGRYEQTKTHSVVKFPLKGLTLDDNYCDINNANKRGQMYDLYGISEHMGSCIGGHYIAHCLNKLNGKWYQFDDSRVHHVPDEDIENEIVGKNAYILFYVRRMPKMSEMSEMDNIC